MYILAINCGSSSIKGKLFSIPSSKSQPLSTLANLGVSNISSKGEKVKINIGWEGGKGKDVEEEGEDGGTVDCELPITFEVSILIARRWIACPTPP